MYVYIHSIYYMTYRWLGSHIAIAYHIVFGFRGILIISVDFVGSYLLYSVQVIRLAIPQ